VPSAGAGSPSVGISVPGTGARVLRVYSPTKPGPPRRLDYTGLTFCSSGRFPAPATRCRLRVGMAFGDAMEVEEVVAYYDPVGWLLESGARIGADRSLAWRLAE
jgi:hypothetical protein